MTTVTLHATELRQMCLALLDYLDAEHPTIDLDADYYWSVEQPAVYNIYAKPNAEDIGLGQLYSDWEDLQTVMQEPEYIFEYHILCMARILEYIGYGPTRNEGLPQPNKE